MKPTRPSPSSSESDERPELTPELVRQLLEEGLACERQVMKIYSTMKIPSEEELNLRTR